MSILDNSLRNELYSAVLKRTRYIFEEFGNIAVLSRRACPICLKSGKIVILQLQDDKRGHRGRCNICRNHFCFNCLKSCEECPKVSNCSNLQAPIQKIV